MSWPYFKILKKFVHIEHILSSEILQQTRQVVRSQIRMSRTKKYYPQIGMCYYEF